MYSLDIKLDTDEYDYLQWQEKVANVLYELIERKGLYSQVLIESTKPYFLNLLQEKNPQLKLFLYSREANNAIDTALHYHFTGISVPLGSTQFSDVFLAHENNIEVALWEISSNKDNQEAIELGPEYIQTDKMKNLLKLLE